jgi:hypothetical protein
VEYVQMVALDRPRARRQSAGSRSARRRGTACHAQTAAKTGDLAKAAQNPVADLIRVPLQNNTLYGLGPDDDTANVLNIQPVIPFRLSPDWNLITRTIVPLIYLPDLTTGLWVPLLLSAPHRPPGSSGHWSVNCGRSLAMTIVMMSASS